MGNRKAKKPRDAFQWFLRQEAKAYDDSQQAGLPRNGVTWCAVDSSGHIAILNSRETGNVPRQVFTNSKKHHLELYEHFGRPSIEQMTGDDEVDAPAQGLFYYTIVDFYKRLVLMGSTLHTDPYDRVGVPESPLHISECPPNIRCILEAVRYDGDFSQSAKLSVCKHWDYV